MNISDSTPFERAAYLKHQALGLLKKKDTKAAKTARCENCNRAYYKSNMHCAEEYGENVYYCNSCMNIKK